MAGFLVYRNCKFSWNVLVCLGMLGYVLISLGIGGHFGVCGCMLRCILVYRGMWRYVGGISGYVGVC